MEGIVAGEVEPAVGRADRFIAGLVSQVERRRVEVVVQSERECEVADRPADCRLQVFAGGDHLVAKLPRIGHRTQIDVRVSVCADLDAGVGHCSEFFHGVGWEGMAKGQIVGERLAVEHVLQRDEVGAGNPMLDQQRDRLVAVLRVAVVERNAHARPVVGPASHPVLGFSERNQLEPLPQPANMPGERAVGDGPIVGPVVGDPVIVEHDDRHPSHAHRTTMVPPADRIRAVVVERQ